MRRILVTLAILVSLVSPATAAAADNGTVSAQVTVPAVAPCITVGDPIDYGTVQFSTPGDVNKTAFGASTYTSCSPDAQKIYVRGTPATSASSDARWTLAQGSFFLCDTGPNVYGVLASDSPDGSRSSVALHDSDQLMNPTAAPGTAYPLRTTLFMPCSGSTGAGETMTFSIILTASF